MSKRNTKNERIKRQYREFLKHADGMLFGAEF